LTELPKERLLGCFFSVAFTERYVSAADYKHWQTGHLHGSADSRLLTVGSNLTQPALAS